MSQRHRILIMCLVALTAILTVAPIAAQGSINVPVWIAFTDARLDWAREKAAAFMEMFPQYNVTVEGYANYEEILDATILSLEQGTAPAIVQWFEVGTQFARDSGYFKPIYEALGDLTEINGLPIDMSEFINPVMGYYSDDGLFTSMPWNTSTPILYANVAMLAEAGIESVPTTWQELDAACETIMALASAPEGCVTWPNHGWFFEQWIAQQNQVLANNDNGRSDRATEVNLTSEAAIDTVTMWQEMYNKGYYLYTGVQRDFTGSRQAFQNGQTAFVITSSADASMITIAAGENGIEVTTGRMPHDAEDGWTGNIIGGASLWLMNNLDPAVEEGALTFLVWFTGTENDAEWHQFTGYVPVRLSSVELLEAEGWYEENPNFFTASDQLNNSQVTPATRGALLGTYNETRNIITQAIEDLMLQGGDPTERMTAAEEEANVLLEEYNSLYVE
jgi:sn-glycerol 3-phosphate transport system substrate-binding protein